MLEKRGPNQNKEFGILQTLAKRNLRISYSDYQILIFSECQLLRELKLIIVFEATGYEESKIKEQNEQQSKLPEPQCVQYYGHNTFR